MTQETETQSGRLVSRTAILILSAVLVGMSLQSTGVSRTHALLWGCCGFLMYIGLQHLGRRRQAARAEAISREKEEAAARRLSHHIAPCDTETVRVDDTDDSEAETAETVETVASENAEDAETETVVTVGNPAHGEPVHS